MEGRIIISWTASFHTHSDETKTVKYRLIGTSENRLGHFPVKNQMRLLYLLLPHVGTVNM